MLVSLALTCCLFHSFQSLKLWSSRPLYYKISIVGGRAGLCIRRKVSFDARNVSEGRFGEGAIDD